VTGSEDRARSEAFPSEWTGRGAVATIAAMTRTRAAATLLASVLAGSTACPRSEENVAVSTESPFPTPLLTFEDVATRPGPGLSTPGALRFSPDDRHVTYLASPDRSLQQSLWAFDPETGRARVVLEPLDGGNTEENLSAEEKLRRERMRQHSLGITGYAWPERGSRILVPLTGDVWVKDGLDAPLRRIVDSGEAPALDPQLSPDGESVGFVQDGEVFVVPTAGGTPRMITSGARGTGKTHGLAEYIAQEEMGRHRGFWWSRDSKSIAFAEVDETHIGEFRIMHLGKAEVGGAAQEDHRYPFAGQPNAKVRLAVVSAAGGRPTYMDLGDAEYLARVDWLYDGRLAVQLENRDQTRLDLVFFDPGTGIGRVVLTESTDVWINLDGLFRPLDPARAQGEAAGGFLWGSERTGFRHLHLYGADGRLIRPLTSGDWMVDGIVDVDEAGGRVFFLGTRDGATQSHLYEVGFHGGDPRRITRARGTHHAVIDHAYQRFVDVHHAVDSPPRITLRSLADDAELGVLFEPDDPRLERLALAPPRLVTLHSRDGVPLHGAVYVPPPEIAAPPYRTMVAVYGGPHAQTVADAWGMTADLRAQFLSRRGVLVFKLDNRGSARRGLAFEGAIKHDMGNIEVQDQVDGVRWLIGEGLADPGHVGIYGWSYGGYMSAMALARAPETFSLAVAGAPVTHWDGYDTHYTERYMGTPQSNAAGYERSSVMAHVEGLAGHLMLVHGLIDENVHFRHTARLIDALVRADKPYELLLFPNERHGPRRLEDRVYMERRIFSFIDENL
jgi:dipeptidyl-peptidase-4